jgi:hypothetical protein
MSKAKNLNDWTMMVTWQWRGKNDGEKVAVDQTMAHATTHQKNKAIVGTKKK